MAIKPGNPNGSSLGILEFRAPGALRAGLGNEGVGEHVRIRFHLGFKIAGEIADL